MINGLRLKIRKDYDEMNFSWKTKQAILPSIKNDDDGLEMYNGGSTDVGDNGFVFSFHVHDKERIKCEQWIKSQKIPFLPYQMIDIWPRYFNDKYKKIDKEIDKQYVYNNWKLSTKDERLMKWIEIIDPLFYDKLKKLHLQFEK